MESAETRLAEKGLSITQPRVAILTYLMNHHTHPIVDSIYKNLREAYPNLSRTTVYNTIKALKECGLIQMFNIDDKHICVDEDTTPHAHLLCEKCGRVYDLPLQGLAQRRMIDGCQINEVHQYYKGICKDCLTKNKSNINN